METECERIVKDNECENALFSRGGSSFMQMDQMNESFKKLKVQSKTEEKEEDLAGNINNVIETFNIVLIKPFSSDNLLYLGTPLFLNSTIIQNSCTNYDFLGYIDDIFGSISEPMYSVITNCHLKRTLNINSEVYYFPNNPNTVYMYIKHISNNVSDEKRYKITTN